MGGVFLSKPKLFHFTLIVFLLHFEFRLILITKLTKIPEIHAITVFITKLLRSPSITYPLNHVASGNQSFTPILDSISWTKTTKPPCRD